MALRVPATRLSATLPENPMGQMAAAAKKASTIFQKVLRETKESVIWVS
jgi:hypothetical protein